MMRLFPRRRNVLRHLGLLAGAALLLGGATSVRAELIWTPERGWEYKGGLLGPLMGDMSTPKSALESMNAAKTAQEGGHFWSALSYYDQIIANYPGSVFAPEALFQKGVIYIQRHQFESAFDSFERIIKRYPDYPNFNGVIYQEFNVADIMTVKRPYLWGWMPWFKDPEKAYDYYDLVVKNAPATEYAPMALMKIALLAVQRSSILDRGESAAKAIEALRRLINDYPQSMLASDAYLEISQIYASLVAGAAYDQGSTRQAIRYLQDYLFYYRDSRSAPEAEKQRDELLDVYARSQLLLGNFYYFYRDSNRAALIFYNQAITLAPKSPAAAEARVQIDKISRGIPAPLTPYDMLFGRYYDHALSPAAEQGLINQLATEAFQARATEDFLETPGDEIVETISGTGQVQEYEGFEPFLNPAGAPVGPPLPPSQLIPVTPPPAQSPSDRPLIR